MTSDANINQKITLSLLGKTPPVDTPAGPVIGSVDAATGVYCYRGIPYAAAPVGPLRWLPPQPLPPWQKPLRAQHFGMPAAQNPSPLVEVRGPSGEAPESEDCLYLNIYAPAESNGKKLPVMLWVHGGAFSIGSGCQEIYNGSHLAASGRAIVVTFNYRLGALGFLRLKDICDIPASGNEGLLDQIAALEWVRKNIAAFGGNPDNITLFGESAGAMSIAAMLAALRSRGLFRRAIVQSGHPGAMHNIERANDLAQAFVEHLQRAGLGTPESAGTRALLQAQQAIMADPRLERSWGQLPFKPVLDGELLQTNTVETLRGGSGTEVSLLLGSNLDEWNLFSATDPQAFTLDDAQIRARLEWLLPDRLLNPLLSHYHRLAKSIGDSPWPEWSRTWNLLLTDMVFTLPGLRLLQAHRGRCFHYHFAQPLAAQPLLGACHAVELGYVFGTHGVESLQPLYGGESEPHRLSNAMREAWLNFAECGHPGEDWPHFCEGKGEGEGDGKGDHGGHSRRFGNHATARPFNTAELAALWQDVPDDLLNGYL